MWFIENNTRYNNCYYKSTVSTAGYVKPPVKKSMSLLRIISIPAVIIMGYLGQRIGEIVDNPKNKADADYKIAVLNALKKMDKSITLQELNEKLTKQVAEPDIPDEKDDVDE